MKTLQLTNQNFYLFKNRLVIRIMAKPVLGTKVFCRHYDNDYLSIALIFKGYGLRVIYDLVK